MFKHLRLITLLTLVLLLPAIFTSQVAEEDARTVMRGFCDGLDLDADIVPDAYIEGDDVADVITLLSAENNRFAVKGLKKLGSVLSRVPDVIENKEGNPGADDLYLKKMQKLSTDLENIDAYEPGDNNNLTVLGVSIVDLVNNATNSLNAKDYYNAGLSMGMALANIFTATQPPVSEEVIAEVQAKAEADGWIAGEVPAEVAQYANIDEFKHNMLGIPDEIQIEKATELRRRRRAGIVPPRIFTRTSFPASFDARTKWPNCVFPIRQQGNCGSCWAFAGTSALADRFCIATQGKVKKVLSPQMMLECEKQSGGCSGGYPKYEFDYIKDHGIFQESCFSYASGESSRLTGRCPAKCSDGSAPNIMYTTNSLDLKNDDDIKTELMTNGPLTTAFSVYQDFMQFKSGIYSHVSGGKTGGHAVKLIGWGTDAKTGKQYWLCANSWGVAWGEQGYFKIKFGDSDINMMVNGGTPDLKRSVTNKENGQDIPGEDNEGNSEGGAEFNKDKGGDNSGQPDDGGQPDNGGEDNGGQDNWDNGGGDDGGQDNYNDWDNNYDNGDSGNDDWSNYNDWDNGNTDSNSDWGNDDYSNNDWGNDDYSNYNDWGSGDDSNNYNDWGNDDYSSDNWDSQNDWDWRRHSKSGVISSRIRSSVRKNSGGPVRKSLTTPKRGPVRRRRRTSSPNQRRSPLNKANIARRASARAAKTVSIRKPEGTEAIQKQVHHLRKH